MKPTCNTASPSLEIYSARIAGAHPLYLASDYPTVERAQPPRVHLTPRQLEVLALLCEGLSNKLICRRLSISSGTVKAHIAGILRELGVSSRLQAVVAAHRQGLIGGETAAVTDETQERVVSRGALQHDCTARAHVSAGLNKHAV